MTGVATAAAPAGARPVTSRPSPRLFQPPGREVTLEDKVLGVWEDLAVRAEAGCPVCGGRMRADHGCTGCGSQLS